MKKRNNNENLKFSKISHANIKTADRLVHQIMKTLKKDSVVIDVF